MTADATGAVDAASRLHFGLIDLVGMSGRRYGGAGVMLQDPSTVVRWRRNSQDLRVHVNVPLDDRARLEIDTVIGRVASFRPSPLQGVISIDAAPPSHRGYGSKTALLMATAQAAANASNLAIDVTSLARMTGRGGASGVGAHGFHLGGLLVDAGHASNVPLLPSSFASNPDLPLLTARRVFPDRWRIGLLDNREGRSLSSDDERQLFTNAASQITQPEVHESIVAVYHGILVAIQTADLALLRTALQTIGKNGFKRVEFAAQPPVIASMCEELSENPGIAYGMSSLGPLVFAIVDRDDPSAGRHAEEVASAHGVNVMWTRARNSGWLATGGDSLDSFG